VLSRCYTQLRHAARPPAWTGTVSLQGGLKEITHSGHTLRIPIHYDGCLAFRVHAVVWRDRCITLWLQLGGLEEELAALTLQRNGVQRQALEGMPSANLLIETERLQKQVEVLKVCLDLSGMLRLLHLSRTTGKHGQCTVDTEIGSVCSACCGGGHVAVELEF
jgi:hypothetical protein